jgi:hypothetical protein
MIRIMLGVIRIANRSVPWTSGGTVLTSDIAKNDPKIKLARIYL